MNSTAYDVLNNDFEEYYADYTNATSFEINDYYEDYANSTAYDGLNDGSEEYYS
jgi:hypothetical protein